MNKKLTISIASDKEPFMSLLLIGDESEKMVRRYLDDGILYIGTVGGTHVAVCHTVIIDSNTVELKNLAVRPEYRKQGIGSAMLAHAEAENRGCTLILGTGETPSTLCFYKSRGYTFLRRIPDFFTENYESAIIEEGVQLRDMIYLQKKLL